MAVVSVVVTVEQRARRPVRVRSVWEPLTGNAVAVAHVTDDQNKVAWTWRRGKMLGKNNKRPRSKQNASDAAARYEDASQQNDL